MASFFVSLEGDERKQVPAAFCAFFCVLSSYYTLLPLRDELGLRIGTSYLPALFVASLVATTVAAPSASVFLSRPGQPKPRLLSQLFLCVAGVLLCFYLLFRCVHDTDGAVVSSASHQQATNERPLPVRASGRLDLTTAQRSIFVAFYLWVGVQNLVCISSIWARCAELFSNASAKRLYGFIGAGSTLGQICGSALTKYLLHKTLVVSDGPPPYDLILLSAVFIVAATFFLYRLDGPTQREARSRKAPTMSQLLDGFGLIWRSPYLLHLCVYMLVNYAVASQFYFEKALVVETALNPSPHRTSWFATLNLISGAFIAAAQLTLTGHLLTRLAFTTVLSIAPIACGLSMAFVAVAAKPDIIGMAEIVRKILTFAVARPARETLFTVLSDDEQYKTKLLIDTIFQRLGDVLGALLFQLFHGVLSFGPCGVALVTTCLCLVWGLVGWTLARRHALLVSVT